MSTRKYGEEGSASEQPEACAETPVCDEAGYFVCRCRRLAALVVEKR